MHMTAETMPDPWPDQEWYDELADEWAPPATTRATQGGPR